MDEVARTAAARSAQRRPRTPPRWRFFAVSLAAHAVLFAGFATVRVHQAAHSPPAVTQAAWEPTAELVPPDEVPPPPDETPPRPTEDWEESDDPPPLEAAWEPLPDASAAIAVVGRDPLRATPRCLPRRRAPATGETGDGPPASPVAAQPRPEPPVSFAPAPREPVRTLPRILEAPRPRYPEAAKAAGIEGTVYLEIDIAADGSVADIRIVRSSGSPLLDGAWIEAVRTWTFTPATEDGTPVATTVRLPALRFRFDV